MAKLFKTILLLLIVTIIGLVALPFIVDPNDYKQTISEQVEKATSRPFNINGDISLTVFPWLALEIDSVTLGNAKGFKAEHFAQVENVEIGIKLLPLLQKQLELDTVVLDGVQLNLEKNYQGQANWEGIGGASDSSKTKTENNTTQTDSNTQAQSPIAGLSIAGIEIKSANILFIDERAGVDYRLEQFNLTTEAISPGKPSQINLDFSFNSKEPSVSSQIALETEATIDVERQLFKFEDLILTTQASGSAIPTGTMNLKLSSHIEANLIDQTAKISDLILAVQDLVIRSEITAEHITSDSPRYNGSLTIEQFSPRQLAQQMDIALPASADENVLEQLAIKTSLSGNQRKITLNDLTINFDQSVLRGKFAVNDFKTQALTFDLALDKIDVDRYLPPVTEKTQQQQASTTKPAPTNKIAKKQPSPELPLSLLRKLDITGKFTIGELIVSGLKSQDIDININAKKGKIALKPLSAKLYQGTYKGDIALDAGKSKLKVSIDEHLSNVEAGSLLRDLTGKNTISGLVNGNIALTGIGKNIDQIKQTLTGKGDFAFEDGAIEGFNIAEMIRNGKAVLKGKVSEDASAPSKTDFSSLTGAFNAKNGLFNNSALNLMSPLLRVKGNGTADINNEKLDYQLVVAVVGSTKGQLGKDLSELKGLSIPLEITGTFSEPKPRIDMAGLLKDNASNKIKTKIRDKVKEKVGDKLGSALGGLLLDGSSDSGSEKAEESQDEPPKSAEDKLKDKLNDELGNALKGLF